MLYCKTVDIENESIDFCIDSRNPIDPCIHDLMELHEIEFDDSLVYPPTVIVSNIVGIDHKQGLFLIGPRFNVYSGYLSDSTGILLQDLQHYLEGIGKPGATFKLKATTSGRIAKDTKWLDSFLKT